MSKHTTTMLAITNQAQHASVSGGVRNYRKSILPIVRPFELVCNI